MMTYQVKTLHLLKLLQYLEPSNNYIVIYYIENLGSHVTSLQRNSESFGDWNCKKLEYQTIKLQFTPFMYTYFRITLTETWTENFTISLPLLASTEKQCFPEMWIPGDVNSRGCDPGDASSNLARVNSFYIDVSSVRVINVFVYTYIFVKIFEI